MSSPAFWRNNHFSVPSSCTTMDRVNLIPRIGERIEQLDTALFSAPATSWRYPTCIIRNIKMDPSGTTLWFKMKNISLETDPNAACPGTRK